MIKFSDVSLNKKKALSKISKVLDSRWLTSGKVTLDLEKKINNHLKTKFISLLSNCTSALHIALICNKISKGDEVLVPSFTWISSVNAILMVGAVPKIVDVDYNTMNISPEIIRKNISKKTKAIMIVHQFGSPCDMDEINKIAKDFKLNVIEDAACALGSKYNNGKFVGNTSNLSCFSLHPRKIVTTGEGGFISSSNNKYEDRIRILLNHGHRKNTKDDYFEEMGFNYRISDIQSAIAVNQIENLNASIRYRSKIADIYRNEITNKSIKYQEIYKKSKSAWQSFVIHSSDPEYSKKIINILKKNKISLRGKYYLAHQQKFLRKFSNNNLPNCEKINNSLIFLPMHNRLTLKQVSSICKIINSI